MSLESAKGHGKNARNQVKAILTAARHDKVPDEDGVEYALEEIKAALDEIEEHRKT